MQRTDREAAEVLKVLRFREAAVRAGDAEAAVSVQADDAVAYELPPPLQFTGPAASHVKALNSWFATWDGPVESVVAEPTILIEGDLAVSYGLCHISGVKKGLGLVDQWSRNTVVLRRDTAGWKIVHEHSSVPMKMDGSGQAANDLKP